MVLAIRPLLAKGRQQRGRQEKPAEPKARAWARWQRCYRREKSRDAYYGFCFGNKKAASISLPPEAYPCCRVIEASPNFLSLGRCKRF